MTAQQLAGQTVINGVGASNVVIVDPSSGTSLGSSVNPVYTSTVIPAVASTPQYGQVKIAVTGTAVQLSSTSYVLQNGVVIAAKNSNTTSDTIGNSSVTNVIDGTGNGIIIDSGAMVGICAGININSIYVNGTAGDSFSYAGS